MHSLVCVDVGLGLISRTHTKYTTPYVYRVYIYSYTCTSALTTTTTAPTTDDDVPLTTIIYEPNAENVVVVVVALLSSSSTQIRSGRRARGKANRKTNWSDKWPDSN